MASYEYLNKEGLSRLWNKAKAAFADKTDTENELNKKFVLPSGGETGQVLQKTASGTGWVTVDGMPDILPVENGGTGCTTVDGIRTMLFNFPTEDQLNEYFDFS